MKTKDNNTLRASLLLRGCNETAANRRAGSGAHQGGSGNSPRPVPKRGAILRWALSVVLVFSLLQLSGPLTSRAEAGEVWETYSVLSGSTSGVPLNTGYYRVSGNTSISNGSGGNGSTITDGHRVVIYIPAGATLSVTGGNGDWQTPGGAGIYLPQNSTLIIRGSGTLNATGGRAGDATNGGNASDTGGDWGAYGYFY